MPSLNSDIDRHLSALGLQSETESEHDTENDSGNESADIDSHCDHGISKTSKKSKKSGLYNTSSDTVQFSQIWPHSALQFEYVCESVSFRSLDIKMSVAGELEVILSKRVSATEKLGRLKLLKKMMYFANIYEWKTLLKFYAARDICIRLNLCLNAPIKHGTTI